MATAYQHVDMAPEASDFLELLRELGHLDDAAIETLSAALMREARPGAPITIAEVRRAAAVWLVDNEAKLRPEARELLGIEWGRLFS